MNKQKQFITPGSYASPTCNLSVLKTRASLLTESNYGDPGVAGGTGGWEEDGEDY